MSRNRAARERCAVHALVAGRVLMMAGHVERWGRMRQVVKDVVRQTTRYSPGDTTKRVITTADVVIEIDVETIARMMGEKALGNKSKVSKIAEGLIVVSVLQGSIKRREESLT